MILSKSCEKRWSSVTINVWKDTPLGEGMDSRFVLRTSNIKEVRNE